MSIGLLLLYLRIEEIHQFLVRLSNRASGLPYNSLRCLTGGIIELGIGASVYEGDVVASGAWQADVTCSCTGSCWFISNCGI